MCFKQKPSERPDNMKVTYKIYKRNVNDALTKIQSDLPDGCIFFKALDAFRGGLIFSPGGAAVSSPGLQPRVSGGKSNPLPLGSSSEGVADTIISVLTVSSVVCRPSGAGDFQHLGLIPGLKPWATDRRPSGAEKRTPPRNPSRAKLK